MKSIILYLFLGFVVFQLNGQKISPDIISSNGNYISNGANNISWTVGEIAVTTISSGNYMITQGFHQPEGFPDNVINVSEDKIIKVYPNPVQDILNIEFKSKINQHFYIQITDIVGNTILKKKVVDEMYKYDFSNQSNGIYILKISSIKTLDNYSFRIIKSE